MCDHNTSSKHSPGFGSFVEPKTIQSCTVQAAVFLMLKVIGVIVTNLFIYTDKVLFYHAVAANDSLCSTQAGFSQFSSIVIRIKNVNMFFSILLSLLPKIG